MNTMKWSVVLTGLLMCLAVKAQDAAAAVEEKEDTIDKNSVVATSRLGAGDLTLPGGIVSMIANGGAVAAGILAVAALALLIMPLFGLRLCSIIGHCDPPVYQAYSSPNSVYEYPAAYNQAGTFNNPQYQKRSLEYVGPILKVLSNAYEKYNTGATTTKKA